MIRNAMNAGKIIPIFLPDGVGKSSQIVKSLDHAAVEIAANLIKKGLLVSVPTDTIYGIACDAQSTTGVESIYKVKRRDVKNRIAICVGDVEDIFKWSRVTVSGDVLSHLLPGPVTVVFERSKSLNPDINPNSKSIAIRIPNHEFIREVARRSCAPLALTSANISADQSCVSINEYSHLWPHLEAVFDGGVLGSNRLGSTIVDLTQTGCYKIIRDGCALDFVNQVLGNQFKLIKIPSTPS